MKSLTKIFIYSLLIFPLVYSQENNNILVVTDSIKNLPRLNPQAELQIKFDEFELHREFNSIKMNIPIDGDPQTVWLRTSLAISTSENINTEFSPHFLSPFQKQYLEDSKFDPIKSILGMAQVGAVGYLAYKHIKKYGFLK